MNGFRASLTPLLFSAAVLNVALPAAQAAPPTPPRATASVELSLTNLDVVVTDAKGNPVHGLVAADFEVLHDGRPVEVTNFSEFRLEGGTALEAASPTATEPSAAPAKPPRRRVVLFFDRLYLPEPGIRKNLFDSVRSLVAETLDDGDDVMIVTWERSIRTVLPFTDDPGALRRALGRIEERCARPGREETDYINLDQEQAWFESLKEDPRFEGIPGDSELTAELTARQSYFEMQAKTAALQGLAATLGGADGRKVLVLVSHRYSRYPGLEFLIRSATDIEQILASKRKLQDARKLLDAVSNAANANGVTLYGLFPDAFEGLDVVSAGRSGGPPQGIVKDTLLQNEIEALDIVASATGGVVLAGGGNVGRLVERVSRDLQSWYSLGYPTRPGTGRAASVSVRVKGRDLTVRTRRAIVEKSVEEQMSDRVLAHLFQPDERSRIPISASLVGSRPEKGKNVLRVEVQIPIGSLALLPTAKGVGGAFSVFVAAVAPEGDFSTVNRLNQPFEIPETELEKAKAGHYTYELDVVTKSPEARIAIGIWDEKTNEAGFALVTPSRT
ncbi:MAG TPA: VWA domain-containing protein [Thermoanaerobaculia bacterium]|jgi:VWFA-related protein|nr:VWA domain-containing protein [Thermoanaerobaculia bacterium]HPA51100.1 VWA domain-containing protein [Thermoanaerobaculia bacterium]HQN07584.1 VWA domain-containing protein [Thermoanaerobaculia bacterium]HQP87362.1 VWA domain-containing protein [Thermoanaerobaculia bacterium]